MKERIVLIGAGSAMFTRGLLVDLIERDWEAELALVDTDPEALKVAEGLARKMIQARRKPVKIEASSDRREALPGATVVITTIGVGGRRAWEKDVFVPRKYGVYQPVGDTAMPGGSSRVLRMVPPMVAIAKDVLELAPRALFLNYANPMSAVCRAVRKATGAPVVGLCIGVPETGRYLAEALGVSLADVTYAAVGINHLTWFIRFEVKGKDAMPRLAELAGERLAGDPLAHDNPFSWSLMRIFGAFPAPLDRHVVEFFPHLFPDGIYHGKKLGRECISFEDTIAGGDRIYDEMRREALSDAPLPDDYFHRPGGEHEQALEIVENIRGDTGAVFSANLPNSGQVPNLPPEAVIECPARATRDGLMAVPQSPVPPGIAGSLGTRFGWVETIVAAALEGNREKFVQALVLDGSVSSLETAEKLADELLIAHVEHLPQFRKGES